MVFQCIYPVWVPKYPPPQKKNAAQMLSIITISVIFFPVFTALHKDQDRLSLQHVGELAFGYRDPPFVSSSSIVLLSVDSLIPSFFFTLRLLPAHIFDKKLGVFLIFKKFLFCNSTVRITSEITY